MGMIAAMVFTPFKRGLCIINKLLNFVLDIDLGAVVKTDIIAEAAVGAQAAVLTADPNLIPDRAAKVAAVDQNPSIGPLHHPLHQVTETDIFWKMYTVTYCLWTG